MPDTDKNKGIRASDRQTMCDELANSGLSLPLAFTPQFVAYNEALVDIIRGASSISPPAGDLRFQDQRWHNNRIYRASMQAYLNWCELLEEQANEIAHNDYQLNLLQMAVGELTTQLNPNIDSIHGILHHAYESRGASLIHDLHRMAHDLITHTLPDHRGAKKQFKAGKHIAATPGAVIYRSDMLELLQYTPITTEVYHKPLLIIPSPLNRCYLCDLNNKNSLVHYLLKQGFQVYCASWRNPLIAHKHWSLDSYVNETISLIRELTLHIQQSSVNLMGFAAGGMLTTIATSLLAHQHQASGTTNPINSATFAITSLQTHLGSQNDPAVDNKLTAAAQTLAQLHDVTDAKRLASNFAWLCPNPLLWNPLVSNYYHGEASANDELFHWNNDTLRITANLYSDFLALTNDNPLLEANRLSFCGIPLNVKDIQCDSYTLAGSCDHITPWESCYQSYLSLGGNKKFVLVNRGHSRSLICPIDAKDSCYYTNADITDNTDDWLSEANQHHGSWWPDWRDWLAAHSGERHVPQRTLGDSNHPKLAPAPGRYVFE